MKLIITIFISTFLMANNYALSGPLDKLERKLDRLFGQEIESGADVKKAKVKKQNLLLLQSIFRFLKTRLSFMI